VTVSPPFIRALTATTLACTRCGSADVHPVVGAFGPLVGLLGFMRHGCRSCRRSFWIRTSAGASPRPAPGPVETSAATDDPAAPRAALDFEVTPVKREKVDLTPLDAEFETIRTGGAVRKPPLQEESPPREEARRRRKRRS
jgi:hypothetical protein